MRLARKRRPSVDNTRQDGPAIDDGDRVRLGPGASRGIQWARIALVQKDLVEGRQGPISDRITSFLSHDGENVSSDIVTAESVQVPVGFDSGELGVVSVDVGICRTDEVDGHSVS